MSLLIKHFRSRAGFSWRFPDMPADCLRW